MFQLKEITLGNIYGSILFLWAFCCQYKAAVSLANLRKDKKGSIVTLEHRVPHGDWFELVSSPHNMAEILMYLALTFILFGSNTWPVVFLWVLSNQVSHATDVPNILVFIHHSNDPSAVSHYVIIWGYFKNIMKMYN
jgi:hypothetical protein